MTKQNENKVKVERKQKSDRKGNNKRGRRERKH